jgi:choline dehydrogenase
VFVVFAVLLAVQLLGVPLAARLSEDLDHSVVLLEAGPDYASRSDMSPDLLDSRNLAGMRHDWNYVATPVEGRAIPYRRGKVTGGTSAINAAAAQWGRPEDFAAWVKRGNPEWGWERVLPFFRRIESDANGQGDGHGRNGPITINRYANSELIPIQRAFYDACREAGFPDVRDHNAIAANASGVGPWPLNREGTTRISTALAYLEPARKRPNFTIRPESVVRRLRFDGNRAIGVELADGAVASGKSIVLAAGAIGSPAILLRSEKPEPAWSLRPTQSGGQGSGAAPPGTRRGRACHAPESLCYDHRSRAGRLEQNHYRGEPWTSPRPPQSRSTKLPRSRRWTGTRSCRPSR